MEIHLSNSYPVYTIQQAGNSKEEGCGLCNIVTSICDDWKFTALVVGSILSIISCVASIFASAYFFSLCFAGLAAVCIFAAKEIRDLGSLKAVSEDLAQEVEQFKGLNNQLEENLHTMEQEHQATIQALHAENHVHRNNNAQLQVQVQSLQSASRAIQEKFQTIISDMSQGTREQEASAKASLQNAMQVMQGEYEKSERLCKGLLQLYADNYQQLNLISRDWARVFSDDNIRFMTKLSSDSQHLSQSVKEMREEVAGLKEQRQRIREEVSHLQQTRIGIDEANAQLIHTVHSINILPTSNNEPRKAFSFNPPLVKV